MAFSISADLPLGTYRGHNPDGSQESMPSVARLHAALLSAAGFGPRAVPDGEHLRPCDADDAALRWLEQNPPDGVSVPALALNLVPATAYRDDGTLASRSSNRVVKKLGKSIGSVAVNGSFTWTWSQNPPPEIVAALSALCPDVAHLGTTESPVRLTAADSSVEPTYTLDPDAGIFSAGGRDVAVPAAGRTKELRDAHTATQPVPTERSDRVGSNEVSAAPVPPRRHVRMARYVKVARAGGFAPWGEVVLLPLDRGVPERDRVRVAVSAHRALIAYVGDGAPPILTGVYPDGVRRPTNRVALQIIDAADGAELPSGVPAALAVLIPHDGPAADLAVVYEAIAQLRRLRARHPVHITAEAMVRPGDVFWPEPEPGFVRLWRTSPPAVPDTRGDDPGWTFAHAALLSLGFVWRNSPHLPPVPGRGAQRDRGIVLGVTAAGAAVLRADPLRTSRVEDFVHRVNEHAVVRPYRALLSVGDLGGARALQAIGQARHLGGGLLVPVDRPEGTPIATVG